MFIFGLDDPWPTDYLLNRFNKRRYEMTQPLLFVYLPYAAIAVALTIWLARTLSRHGEVFLETVFPERHDLAHAVNHLLVIGFYLVNLGWALLLLRSDAASVTTSMAAVEVLATKLGTL